MSKSSGNSKLKNREPRRRNPEDEIDEQETLDDTIADSFPASDPPSSIPDPDEQEDAA